MHHSLANTGFIPKVNPSCGACYLFTFLVSLRKVEEEEALRGDLRKEIGKWGKSMSSELPRMDITAAGDLGEYRVSFVSILQSELYVRWQSRLDYV